MDKRRHRGRGQDPTVYPRKSSNRHAREPHDVADGYRCRLPAKDCGKTANMQGDSLLLRKSGTTALLDSAPNAHGCRFIALGRHCSGTQTSFLALTWAQNCVRPATLERFKMAWSALHGSPLTKAMPTGRD